MPDLYLSLLDLAVEKPELRDTLAPLLGRRASDGEAARKRLIRVAYTDPKMRERLLPWFRQSKIQIDWDKVEQRLYDHANPRPPNRIPVKTRLTRSLYDEAKFGTIDHNEIKELLKAFDNIAKKSRGPLGDKGMYWHEKEDRRMSEEEMIAQIQPEAVIG